MSRPNDNSKREDDDLTARARFQRPIREAELEGLRRALRQPWWRRVDWLKLFWWTVALLACLAAWVALYLLVIR